MKGCIVLFLEPKTGFDEWRARDLAIGERHWVLNLAPDSTSDHGYRSMNIYHTSDITKSTQETVQDCLESTGARDHVCRWSCHTYKELACLRGNSSTSTPPIVVSSGFTIEKDPMVLADFEKWYKEEHVPGLSTVQGWRATTRYEHITSFGDQVGEATAQYIALHEWEAENGLGTEAWRKVVFTPWTERILKTQTQPMQRSKWVAAEKCL
jgi:hypothetical protein